MTQKLIRMRMNAGQDTYAGRVDAWHQLGNVTGVFNTWKELLQASGSNFRVVKRQLEYMGVKIDAYGTFRIDEAIPKGLEDKAIPFENKGKTGFASFLGTVGEGYEVIQHTTGFELLDSLVGSIDGAHYETMGTLDFGKIVWGQVNPKLEIRVGDDVSTVFLTFLTSHDGSKATEVYETAIRQVCRNTVRIGSLKRLANSLRVKHTKNAQTKMEGWKAELVEISNVAMTMQERLNFLAHRQVTRESMETVMNRLFPVKKNAEGEDEESTRRKNNVAELLAIYESNDNNAFPEQRGTAYNLLNSVTNYVDHVRSTKGDGRAVSAVFGSGDKMKSTALDIIFGEAEKMPEVRERLQVPVGDALSVLGMK